MSKITKKTCNPNAQKAQDTNFICNPETGRWVSKTGAIGKKLIEQYGSDVMEGYCRLMAKKILKKTIEEKVEFSIPEVTANKYNYNWLDFAEKIVYKGYHIYKIKKGTILYRGIRSPNFDTDKIESGYWGSLETALMYSFLHGGSSHKIIFATPKEDLYLLDMTNKENFELLRKDFTIPIAEIDPTYFNPFQPPIPRDYHGKDILYFAFSDGAKRLSYMDQDKQLLDFICKKIGILDGWAVSPMPIVHGEEEEGEWHDEILLCDPSKLEKLPWEIRYIYNKEDDKPVKDEDGERIYNKNTKFYLTENGKLIGRIPFDDLRSEKFNRMDLTKAESWSPNKNNQSDFFIFNK